MSSGESSNVSCSMRASVCTLTTTGTMGVLLEFFVREYKHVPERLMLLAQALEMRTCVVLLDGVDEAAGRRDALGGLMKRLLESGIPVVASCRPDALSVEDSMQRVLTREFAMLDVLPLSEVQSRDVFLKQLRTTPRGHLRHALEHGGLCRGAHMHRTTWHSQLDVRVLTRTLTRCVLYSSHRCLCTVPLSFVLQVASSTQDWKCSPCQRRRPRCSP